jgi:hypothetical protein
MANPSQRPTQMKLHQHHSPRLESCHLSRLQPQSDASRKIAKCHPVNTANQGQ